MLANNYNRLLAGGFAGAGAIILILTNHAEAGIAILSSMVGFFVGEKNGERKAEAESKTDSS